MKTHHDLLTSFTDISVQEPPVQPRPLTNQQPSGTAMRELPFSVTPMRAGAGGDNKASTRMRFFTKWITEYSVAEYAVVFLASFTAIGLLVFLVMM